ncbi:MAG: 2,3-bisphosphoglycerate-independent phosphoglycerate mutase [Candidatus Gottesmanbacteria bacterium GW2011_GWA1_47_8]|uniref:2,3-bisphosphoglycerate-independent phosphoglycerate mutase n=1 Tax=Candidatus Gottesmanbacteria bacterium GW2011_GWA1_47_8 TaxID=1618438 RepID=A0A0G1WEN2_9BACT|nr:MAG: 2,3-bisphosphoglycerate-independent phosphoglycerate mutase [Candidatus Gottesmanbacteria bacterium GW2011_GWA1_47_8]
MKQTTKYLPLVLLILDGWGEAPGGPGNAIAMARKPNFDSMIHHFPHTTLEAAGEAVGMPNGEDGNSEVGHLNLGAGRIVPQSLVRINMSIVDGSFFQIPDFLKAIEHVRANHSSLHLLGMVGSGSVHAFNDHLFALLQLAKKNNLDQVYLHLISDGRDSPPTAGKAIIARLSAELKTLGLGSIATILGRYYAMDRDLRWERTEQAYQALTDIKADHLASAAEVFEKYYALKLTDEFISPTIVGPNPDKSRIKDNDAVIFFNFRIDRPRQLTKAFVQAEFETQAAKPRGFDPYETKYYRRHSYTTPKSTPFKRQIVLKNLFFVTMVEYEPGLGAAVAFPPLTIDQTLGEVLSLAGLRQSRIAESEKERFVTYFFDGGKDIRFPREEVLIIPSPSVTTYDQQPAMSTPQIVESLVELLDKQEADVYIVNFAAPDMVGHTGDLEATVHAVEAVDEAIGNVYQAILKLGGTLVVTADHGNAEEIITPRGEIDTEHSTNPVPLIIVNHTVGLDLHLPLGVLGDVAPTILKLIGLKVPPLMTGSSLI